MKKMLYELLALNPSIVSFARLIFCTHYCPYILHCLPFRMPERQGAIEMSEAPLKRTGPTLPPPPSQTRKTTLFSSTIVHTITGATKTKKKKKKRKTRISTQTTDQGPRNLSVAPRHTKRRCVKSVRALRTSRGDNNKGHETRQRVSSRSMRRQLPPLPTISRKPGRTRRTMTAPLRSSTTTAWMDPNSSLLQLPHMVLHQKRILMCISQTQNAVLSLRRWIFIPTNLLPYLCLLTLPFTNPHPHLLNMLIYRKTRSISPSLRNASSRKGLRALHPRSLRHRLPLHPPLYRPPFPLAKRRMRMWRCQRRRMLPSQTKPRPSDRGTTPTRTTTRVKRRGLHRHLFPPKQSLRRGRSPRRARGNEQLLDLRVRPLLPLLPPPLPPLLSQMFRPLTLRRSRSLHRRLRRSVFPCFPSLLSVLMVIVLTCTERRRLPRVRLGRFTLRLRQGPQPLRILVQITISMVRSVLFTHCHQWLRHHERHSTDDCFHLFSVRRVEAQDGL